ncbi:hypothetical protein HDU67_010329 [Dinochytrium kinnereticum]|nr:hypothetical protein HDU67_010329 [Dinochytrium kinnereticum]
MRDYGPVAFVTYSLVSAVSLTAWYAAFRLGFDVSRFTNHIPKLPHLPFINLFLGEDAELRVLDAEARFVMALGGVVDGMVDVAELMRERVMEGKGPVVKDDHVGEVVQRTVPSAGAAAGAGGGGRLAEFYATHGTTVLVAIAAHNVILPIRVGVTALLTPWVAVGLRRWGVLRRFAGVAAVFGGRGSARKGGL